ncbi:hypothetical protein B4907_15270 [Yersinia kristensenii]|nr:hypothetical protein B4907_15270 [Yersinia kristensenii]
MLQSAAIWVVQTNTQYPSSFKLQVCWLLSVTRITYLCKLIGIISLAAFLHLEIYWVWFRYKKLRAISGP